MAEKAVSKATGRSAIGQSARSKDVITMFTVKRDMAKVLVDYAKENEIFALKGGFLDGKAIDTGEIQTLATLPSLDQLRGQLVGLLQAPASKLARLLNEPAAQLARLVAARKDALGEG